MPNPIKESNQPGLTVGGGDPTALPAPTPTPSWPGGGPAPASVLAKGDLLIYDGAKFQRLAAGPDGYALTSRIASVLGVNWEAVGGGGLTITNPLSVKVTGVEAVDITRAPYNAGQGGDDAPIFRQARSDVAAAGGGDIYVPNAHYLFTSPPVTGGGLNTHVPLADFGTRGTVRFIGGKRLGIGPGSHAHVDGAVIESTYVGWNPALGTPSLFGNGTGAAGIDGNYVFEDLILRQPLNPNAMPIDPTALTSCTIRRCIADTTESAQDSPITQPTHPAAIAFGMPAVNNHGFCIIEDCFAVGYWAAIRGTEHTIIRNSFGYQCMVGLIPVNGNDSNYVGYLSFEQCGYLIAYADGSGLAALPGGTFWKIGLLNFEDAPVGNWAHGNPDIYDPANLMSIEVVYQTPGGRALVKNGGTSVVSRRLAQSPDLPAYIPLAPYYINSWVDKGGGFEPGRIYQDAATGRVFMSGVVTGGAAATQVLTIPFGQFRPHNSHYFPAGPAGIEVGSGGDVTLFADGLGGNARSLEASWRTD